MKINGTNIAIFSKNLIGFRKSLNKSQGEFGIITGNKQTTISNYENGKSEPDFNFLIKLKNMGCDLNWLIAGNGEAPSIKTNDIQTSIITESIKSLGEKIDKQEEINKKFIEIPDKVKIIEKQIKEIHDRITEGNDNFNDYAKVIVDHSQKAKDFIFKNYGEHIPNVPPFHPPKKNRH
jgi:transcriptional regulator with XRE-family HTH domain